MSVEPTPEARIPTILAVDDNEDALALLKAGLTARGFRLHMANDGQSALRQARAELPDLVLLDACMPDMDGHEVLRQLRETPATADVPVVFLTASSRDPAMIQRGLADGADDYLLKPIRMDELVARITPLLRRRGRERDCWAAIAEAHGRVGALRGELRALGALGSLSDDQHERLDVALGTVDALDLLLGSRLPLTP